MAVVRNQAEQTAGYPPSPHKCTFGVVPNVLAPTTQTVPLCTVRYDGMSRAKVRALLGPTGCIGTPNTNTTSSVSLRSKYAEIIRYWQILFANSEFIHGE